MKRDEALFDLFHDDGAFFWGDFCYQVIDELSEHQLTKNLVIVIIHLTLNIV